MREYRTIARARDDGDFDVLACFIWDNEEASRTLAQFDAMVETVLLWFKEGYGDEIRIFERQDIPDIINNEDSV